MNEPRIIAYYPDFCGLFDGCVSCAVLLSQLVYWHGEGKDGKPRYNVSDHEGNFWLAKSYAEWHEETGITRDKSDRALTRLRARGIITTRIMRFGGSPTLHVRFLALKGQRKTITAGQIIKDHVQLSDSHVAIPANANADTCNFTTETTTKTTTNILEPGLTPETKPGQTFEGSTGKIKPKGKNMAGLKDILSHGNEKQGLAKPKVGVLELRLASLWKNIRNEQTGKLQPPLKKVEAAQLKKVMDFIGPDTNKVIRWTLENWEPFCKKARSAKDLASSPSQPHVGFLLSHCAVAYSVYQNNVVEQPSIPPKHFIAKSSEHLEPEELENFPDE